jgi:glycosyltransferase involved in cell wall biosynthesis
MQAPDRKRILYLETNQDGTIGGSYFSLFYLVKELNKAEYEPIVLFCSENAMIARFRKYANVIVDPFSSSSSMAERNICDYLKAGPRMIRYVILKLPSVLEKLSKIKPDLVHLNNAYDINHEWILASRLKGIKIVSHDRGTRPPVSLQTRMLVKMIDCIICVSDAFLLQVKMQKLRPKMACTIHNGLDFAEFKPAKSSSDIRRQLGISDKETVLAMIGNIDTWKGQHVFLQAFSRINDRFPNMRALIVGRTVLTADHYERKLKAFIRENGLSDKVYMLGFRNDIPDLMNAADIFIHASIKPEPFGRVILEAMALGKPVIATNAGGVPEIICHDETGLLIPMNDPQSMADSIEMLLADTRRARQIGWTAQRSVRERFSSEKMARGVERVYYEVFCAK